MGWKEDVEKQNIPVKITLAEKATIEEELEEVAKILYKVGGSNQWTSLINGIKLQIWATWLFYEGVNF